ncbi:MAG: hypothetical protein J6Q54_03045, partial [Oscillospiraceae bacterium]|nr:hypothetical protein [Oscillospiraceae bacterium]
SHYRLVGEQTPSKVLTVAADTAICIDLNGYGFTGPSTNGVRVFEIAAGGTLTIMDSVGTGVITGGIHRSTNSSSNTSTDSWGRGGNIYNAGTVNLYSGTITDGIGSTGTVYGAAQGGNYFGATGSVLNVYGGTITNGKLTHGSYFNSETKAMVGGNIFSYGTVNISGGTISGGKVERTDSSTDKNRDIFCYGGNIGVVDGTLNITGGVITGGVITGGRTNNTIYGRNVRTFGGNIYTKNATVTFSNGEISDGTVRANVQTTGTTTAFIADVYANGGNIYAYGGSFTMTGGTISGGSLSTKIINQGETTKDKADVYYSRGGNAYFESCAITISGGLIDAGTATFTQDDDDTTQDTYGAGQGGNVFVGAGCTVNFSAGTISNGFAHSVGGNLFNNATFNMTGGQILDGSVTDTVNGYGTGGNLQNAKTFNMSGGLMSGGRAYYRGGNVYNAGTVAMSGGAVMTEGILNGYTTYTAAYGGNYYGTGVLKLYDNAVIKNGTAYNGGNICTATSNGDIYMYGGMIYGGYAHKYGPDVRIYNDDGCSLYMYGGFINNLNDGGTDNRIDLYNGVFKNDVSKFTTLQGATAMMSCAHYTKLANGYYNVWHAEGTCATCGHTYTNYGVGNTYTTSATEHLTLGGTHTYVDGVCSTCGLAEVAHTAACSHGCENVTWTPWDGVTLENGGHYYLTDNLVVANALTVSVANVCIDLNGYTLTAAPADRAFTMSNNCVLNLMDSSADNTGLLRSFGLTGEKSGGLLYVSSGGTMTLYDLTVANGSTTGDRGGNIYVYGTEATLVVNNAKILNGTLLGATDRRGGNICAYYKANVVIKGADTYIANGWAYGGSSNCYGGNIHLGQGCDLYIYDGLIEGGVAANGANLSVVNGKESDGQKGYFYMYGGTIGGNGNYENGKPCTTNSIRISQSSSNTSDMFMYGGTIAGTISADGTVGEVYIYAGKVK